MVCPMCSGAGEVIDPVKIGEVLRDERENAHIGLRAMARALSLSSAYLSDLELGRRGKDYWTEDHIALYRQTIETLKKEQS